MERIIKMIVLLATTVAFLTGCLPVAGTGSDGGGTLTGPCARGDSNPCTTPSGCPGIQVCGYTSLPGGGHGTDLHWGLCTGPDTCAMADAGTPGTDAGTSGDAGMTPVDAGTPGTDAGMPGADAGPACDPTIVRSCMGACGVPGAIGFLVDSCDSSSPCVRDLTSMTGGCTPVTPTDCPCVGIECSLIVACLTVCDYAGVQTWQDFCLGDACYPIFPESCMPMTDAGMMSGTDAGVAMSDAGPPVVDAGMDAGTDAGSDAGPPPPVDAGTDSGPPPPVDAGTDSGPPPVDAGSDAGPSCVSLGYDICGNGLDEDCNGADLVCPPGVTTSGVYIVLNDGSVATWCTAPETVEPWCWDNTGPTVADYEHFGAAPLLVPVGAGNMELNGSVINSTVMCRYGTTRYAAAPSARITGATVGADSETIGVRVFINGREVPAFICWDTPSSTRTDPNLKRVQFVATTNSTLFSRGCSPGTGP